MSFVMAIYESYEFISYNINDIVIGLDAGEGLQNSAFELPITAPESYLIQYNGLRIDGKG